MQPRTYGDRAICVMLQLAAALVASRRGGTARFDTSSVQKQKGRKPAQHAFRFSAWTIKDRRLWSGEGKQADVLRHANRHQDVLLGLPHPIPLDASLGLRKHDGLTPGTVRSVLVEIPSHAEGVVGNSTMPDVNCQRFVALALVMGAVSVADSHDAIPMRDPAPMDPAAPRGVTMDVTITDGRSVSFNTRFPPGTKENSLTTEGLDSKARDLMTPVLGRDKTEVLIKQIDTLEDVTDKRQLRPLYPA